MADKTVIQLLEEIEESSIFGAEADRAYNALRGVDSISKLMAIELESPEVTLRTILETLANRRNRRSGGIVEIIAAIPSVAVQEDFI